MIKKTLTVVISVLAIFASAVSVTPAYAATLTVTNADDSGAGSLRDTLASAASGDTINFDSSLAGATIHLASTITLSQDVTIDGSALAVPITISGDSNNDGNGDVQILSVGSGVTVILDNLALAKGNAANDVGGAIVSSGTLTIHNSTLNANYSKNGGGAIYNYAGNTLTVTDSTFSNNATPGGGGGILNVGTLNVSNSTFSYNVVSGGGGGGGIATAGDTTVSNSAFSHNTASSVDGAGIFIISGTTSVTGSTFDHNSAASGAGILIQTGSATVSNSTFAGNTATGIAGGIYNNGTLNLTNSTFSGNTASVGDGVYNNSVMNFSNNILANSSFNDCYNTGTIGTHTNNLVEVGNCPADSSSDPQLDILADNGGPLTSSGQATQTMALLPGSPAIDAGDDPTCAAAPVSNLDQRGATRPFGTHCDLGAVEYVTTYVVTKAADTNDGACDADCSLHEAIVAANADASGDTILFNGDYTITLGASLPGITDDLTIDGKGHTIILDGAHTYNMLDASASLYLKNLTIQHAANGNGGAVLTRSPSAITNVTFDNNAATSNGGAVYNYQTTLSITNSTFTGNFAGGGGGAIKNDNGTLVISNSTFSANSADTGGAIIALGGATTLNNNTFSGNIAATQAGGVYNNGTLNYANTIIANSSTNSIPGGDCVNDGGLGINLTNLVEDGSCSATLNGDPHLGTLASNGGSTQTFALPANSTAINAGNDTVCAVSPVSGFDQRGASRPSGLHCDIGSYEYHTIAPSVDSFTAPSPSHQVDLPLTTFTASDDIAVTGYLVTESATPPSPNAAGWKASAPTYYTVAGEGAYTLYPWVKDMDNNVSAVYSSPATVEMSFLPPYIIFIERYHSADEITNADTLSFAVHFYGSVTNVDPSDFIATGGTTATATSIPIFSGDTAVVTISGGDLASFNGTVGLDISPSQDIVGVGTGKHLVAAAPNPNETYTLDNTAPTITGFSATSPISTLDIPISSFTASDNVAVTGYKITETATPPSAGASGWTASAPSSYTVGGSGSYTLYPWAKDAAGNVSAVYGSPASVSVDTIAPAISSITRITASPSAKASVQFLVTFSESVTSITTADFSLTSTVTGASIASVSGSGTTRTVTVNTGSGNGTIRLDIPNTATITDLAGNALSGLPFTGGETYTINKTLTFTSTASQDGWILESSETSNTGGALNSAATTFRLGDEAADKQYRSILSFNTATLPDNATITGVTLKIKRPTTGFLTGNNNPFNWGLGLKVDVCKNFFGATNALQTGDFSYNNAANCKLLAGIFGSTPSANWYSANVLSAAFAKINLAGLTQFRLRFAKDDNDDGLADYLSFYSGNVAAGSQPQLVITYYLP